MCTEGEATMVTPSIGENAGKVWNALNKKGAMKISALKKTTRLDEKSLYLAIGWLAREDNVTFERKQRQTVVQLAKK